MEDNFTKLQDLDFDYLTFCPVIHNNDLILATWNSKQVQVYLK